MRRVERSACPAVLDGPGSLGYTERDAAIALYSVPPIPKKGPKFKHFKHTTVVEQLIADYAGKCAYCEAFFLHTAPIDVDHYRPKNAFRKAGADKKPGYYWLGAEWGNLFPSCISCNRRRRQPVAGEGPKKVGKGTHFPLKNESRRATTVGSETLEEPLLLNPDQWDVEQHLAFGDDGIVTPAILTSGPSIRGKASIDIYGLQRQYLVNHRAERLLALDGSIARYQKAASAFLLDEGDLLARAALEEALRSLTEHLCCKQEYLAMVRQRITEKCPELVPLPFCTAGRCL